MAPEVETVDELAPPMESHQEHAVLEARLAAIEERLSKLEPVAPDAVDLIEQPEEVVPAAAEDTYGQQFAARAR